MKLNTEDPNCFVYEAEELLIELLGGVRIDTLDRMRVTIKVTVIKRRHPKYVGELSGLAVRHNLDLYNDTQVEKFVRRVAEKLEVGSVAITKAIADITSELEAYRLTQLDKKDDKPVKKLTEQERKDALQFLHSKNFCFQRVSPLADNPTQFNLHHHSATESAGCSPTGLAIADPSVPA